MEQKESKLKKIIAGLKEKLNLRKVFLLYGDYGLNAIFYENSNFVESYYCLKSEIAADEQFKEKLSEYKGAEVYIILSGSDINMHHETLTVIDSLNKSNPVEKYCESHLTADDLYSYKVYSITKDHADLWKTVIFQHSKHQEIENLLTLIRDTHLKFSAVYFYPIIAQDFALNLARQNKFDLKNHIYSVVSISSVSGITITLNHGDNILVFNNFEYPADKSLQYIQGVVEQSLSDMWLKVKSYIEQEKLPKVNMFFLPNNLKALLQNSNLEVEKNIFSDDTDLTDIFSDKMLVGYFKKSNQSRATSRELKSYYLYNFINNSFSAPVYLLMLIFFAYSIFMQFYNSSLTNNVNEIYKNYYKVHEQIRLKAGNFPNISNISQLADLYNLKNQLSMKKQVPFDLIEDFIANAGTSFNVNRIYWELIGDINQSYYVFDFELNIDKSSKSESIKDLDNIENILQAKYPKLKLEVQRMHSNRDLKADEGFTVRLTARGE